MVRRRAVSLLLASTLLFGVWPGTRRSAQADDAVTEVFALTNAARLRAGLRPVRLSTVLGRAAQAYADEMAHDGLVAHQGRDGSTLVTRDEAAGYTDWTLLAENLAAGQTSASEAVAAWLNSPEHRANLLSPRVQEIGIGYTHRASSFYQYFWVQEFGERLVNDANWIEGLN